MNKNIVLVLSIFIGFSLLSCKSKRSNVNKNVDKENLDNVNLPKMYPIAINITSTESYCGGAAPNDQIMLDLQTPKKLANTAIYIRNGETNDWNKPIIAEGISDENGLVKVELPDGIYCVVFSNKSTKKEFDSMINQYGEKTMYREAIDKECLLNFMMQPEIVFTVKNGKTGAPIIINRHKPCDWNSVPCSEYHGPLPPSTPPRGK